MNRYPEKEGEDPKYLKVKRIVVETEEDKEQVLKFSRYIHDFAEKGKKGEWISLDNWFIPVNFFMHLYCQPDLIEVERKTAVEELAATIDKEIIKRVLNETEERLPGS
jgi:hypothetical protein